MTEWRSPYLSRPYDQVTLALLVAKLFECCAFDATLEEEPWAYVCDPIWGSDTEKIPLSQEELETLYSVLREEFDFERVRRS